MGGDRGDFMRGRLCMSGIGSFNLGNPPALIVGVADLLVFDDGTLDRVVSILPGRYSSSLLPADGGLKREGLDRVASRGMRGLDDGEFSALRYERLSSAITGGLDPLAVLFPVGLSEVLELMDGDRLSRISDP